MEATPQTDAPEIGLVGRMIRVFYVYCTPKTGQDAKLDIM